MKSPFQKKSGPINIEDLLDPKRNEGPKVVTAGGRSIKASSTGGSPGITSFAPQFHDLLYNNLAQYHTPASRYLHNKLMTQIYTYDTIAGPAVDLYSELPWSTFELAGIEDRRVLQTYQDALSNLKLEIYLPTISTNYLVYGRMCLHLLFDTTQGVWSNMILHNDDDLRITPVPFLNEDPIVDFVPSKQIIEFINSKDERSDVYRQYLSEELVEQIRSGNAIPLDPANTLYLPRKRLANDYLGTSIFSRIIGLVILERALFNASTAKAQRGAGAIRLLKVGSQGIGEDAWVPTDDEVDELVRSLMIAEEDPVGSIIGVKTQDITIETVAGAGNEALWRISDEVEYIQNAKFKALGISEAMLNGDATYNNMEQALSIFLDKIRTFRDFMTRKIIIEKVLEPIAKAHGFYAKKQKGFQTANVHRKGIKTTIRDTSDADLILPTIQWSKPLEPRMDQTLIELYRTAEEVGLPISMRKIAIAVGSNIQEILAEAEEDLEIRKKLSRINKERAKLKAEGEGGEDEFGEGMGGGPSGGGGGGMDMGAPGEGGEPGDSSSPSMEEVEPPAGGDSVVDDVPPPPDGGQEAPASVRYPWTYNHPMKTASSFCGVQDEILERLARLKDSERKEAMRLLTQKERAVAKYALSYCGSGLKMTAKEVALVAKILQRYKTRFTKENEKHLFQLQRAASSPVDFLASLK